MNNLLKCLSSTGRIWCFTYPLSRMALSEWNFMSDDDPWKVSVFVSAIVELFLSILLLLGAAIAFITSRITKFFGLDPPCTYIGCSHPLHTQSLMGQRVSTPPCKSKELCTGEFCSDCHHLRIHSKLHSNSSSNQEDGSCSEGSRKRSAFGFRDCIATEQDLDGHLAFSGEHHETWCSCSDSPLYKRQNQRKGPNCTALVRGASSSKLNEDDLRSLSARFGSESSGGFDAEYHCEISQFVADSEEERAWNESNVKKDNFIDGDASLAHDSETLKSNVASEDLNRNSHCISRFLSKSNQAEGAEPLPYCAVDEVEGPKVLKNNFDKLVGHEAKLAELEKQWPSQCSEFVQSTDNKKGSSNDFDMLGSHPSLSSVDLQTAKNFSAEGLHRNGGMVDACNEEHLNARFPIHKESSNKLVQDGELLEDRGPVNIAIHLGGNIQGTGSNVSESKKDVQHSRSLMSKKHLDSMGQKVDADDCSEKGLVVYLSSLELSSEEVITEGLQKASLQGADAPCEKDGRLSEGDKAKCVVLETNCDLKQGELSTEDPGKGVKHVLDDAIATKDFPDEPASTNAMAQRGRLPKHVEEMALSVSPLEAEDDEEEFVLEEGQEEGLDALKLALQAERSVLAALEAELENERNAAATATSEAMAMISRLQEEKSAMQMEVAQLQRMSEEKADYDEQAMVLLKEILFKREKENIALEKEVELYRETLSAEKADALKRNWHSEGTGSPSPQSLKPLTLTNREEELLSSIEAMNQMQALAFSEKLYQSGTRSAAWIPQSGRSLDLEELNAFSLDQNVNKRSADSPMSDTALSTSSRVWDNEGKRTYHLNGGLHGPSDNSEQLKKMGRSVFSTNDEETRLILERLWVLEEELQELRGKDGLGSQKLWSKAHGAQQLAINLTNGRADKGDQSVCGMKNTEQREEVEMDGIAEGVVPIHDVYEVHSTSNCSPPFVEERDPPEGFEGMSGNSELPPGSISESFSPARMARHRIQIPPRISQARKSFPSDESPCSPVFTPQAAGWIVGKCSHPEDLWDHHALQSQALVSSEERRMATEEIQQLAVRLKALEEDRELLRETLESFKQRGAELNLLQEIAQHLRELRMAGFMRVSEGFFAEEVSVTSPSKSRALKRRRYCSGPGQTQMFLLQRKSI